MSALDSSLTNHDAAMPEGHYAEEHMKQTVVPNRNAIFSSLLFATALSLSKQHKGHARIALGVHSGHHAIYPDVGQRSTPPSNTRSRLGIGTQKT